VRTGLGPVSSEASIRGVWSRAWYERIVLLGTQGLGGRPWALLKRVVERVDVPSCEACGIAAPCHSFGGACSMGARS